jgi:four helix bundle protein
MIKSHRDLDVYKLAFELAMKIFKISKNFPIDERYSLTDQIRRSSRSVCSNIAEAYRKRRYPKSFVSKLSDSEAEAAETQTWLEFSFGCKYISNELFEDLDKSYNNVIGKLVVMMNQSEKWTL